MKSLTAVSIVAAFIIAFAHAAEPAPPAPEAAQEFVRPYPIVAVSDRATDGQKAAAKEIADAIGGPVGRMESPTNPVCCVWIEVTGWTPNPGEPGFFIINQGGGSIVSASDEKQLRLAVEAFKKSIRKNGNNEVEVPVGMITSYHVVSVPAAAK